MPLPNQAGCTVVPAGNTAWLRLAILSQKEFVPPEGRSSSGVQTRLPPELTEWHTHGRELKGEDGQGGVRGSGMKEDCDYRWKIGG